MSTNPKLIEAILTNNKLTEEEKSKLISEFIESIQSEFPELKYHATKSDVKEVELKLTKEIEDVRKEIEVVRKEIKEVELRLLKEIEDVRKEIEVVRKEIKEVELRLSKEIEDVRKEIKDVELRLVGMIEKSKNTTIKWVVGVMFAQLFSITGIIFAAFKIFM